MSGIPADSMPDAMKTLYFDMVKAGVKARLVKDPNYASFKSKKIVDQL